MGRQPQPERRAELLAGCTAELLRSGSPTVSLADLAVAVGTSSRMLVYHFGTRDRLLREMVGEARRRQQELFGATLQPVPGRPYLDNVRAMWSLLADPAAEPYLRLFRHIHDHPDGRALWPEFREASVRDWLPDIQSGLAADGYEHPAELATALLALVRGLLLDLSDTGDAVRTTAALGTVISLLDSASRPADPVS